MLAHNIPIIATNLIATIRIYYIKISMNTLQPCSPDLNNTCDIVAILLVVYNGVPKQGIIMIHIILGGEYLLELHFVLWREPFDELQEDTELIIKNTDIL